SLDRRDVWVHASVTREHREIRVFRFNRNDFGIRIPQRQEYRGEAHMGSRGDDRSRILESDRIAPLREYLVEDVDVRGPGTKVNESSVPDRLFHRQAAARAGPRLQRERDSESILSPAQMIPRRDELLNHSSFP